MSGKAKCKALKEIRQKIAEENDIEYVVSECTYQGECTGTCPRCEAELRYLEKELERRKKLGVAVTIAGVGLGTVAVAAVAKDAIQDYWDSMLSGIVEPYDPETFIAGDIAEE